MRGRRAAIASVVLVAAGVLGTAAAAQDVAPAANGKIAFTSYRDGGPAIYTMNADGSGQQRLTTTANAAFEGEPAFSPDGTRIAYVCGNFELCVMNADGSGQALVVANQWPLKWEYVGSPSWSPDGTRIAFDKGSLDGKFDLYVVNVDETGLTMLPELGSNEDPAWSPDGTRIAYESDAAGSFDIYVVNADGSGRTQLTNTGANDFYPAWSPDGVRIVFTRRGGDYKHVFVMNADGSGQTPLTSGNTDEYDPSWSPDGSKITFTSARDGALGVFATNADGTNLVDLTSNDPGLDLSPAWQPLPSATPADPSAPVPATPISVPTGDAQLVGAYFQWSTLQLYDADGSLPVESQADAMRVLARVRGEALRAGTVVAAIEPTSPRGAKLKQLLGSGFADTAAGARDLLLAVQAKSRGATKAAQARLKAGMKLVDRGDTELTAAGDLTGLDY